MWGKTQDIGSGGIFVKMAPKLFAGGEALDIELPFRDSSGKTPYRLTAHVIRRHRDGVALVFEELNVHIMQQLKHYEENRFRKDVLQKKARQLSKLLSPLKPEEGHGEPPPGSAAAI